MNPAAWGTRHARPLIFVVLLACAAGLAMLGTFPVAILPDVTFPRLVVIADAGDRPASAVELTVTRVLEQAVATVPGVSRVRATTQRGAAELSLDMVWGTDMQAALQAVNTRINDARRQLPAETSVQVERMNPTVFPILGLAVTSDRASQTELWSWASWDLRPRLGAVPGVARAVVQGGQIPEMVVQVRPDALDAVHLALPDLEQALTGGNIVRSVGRLDRRYQQEQIVVSGQVTAVGPLADLVVTQRNGVPVTLGMVADIHPGVQDRTTVVTANGAPAVLLNIVRQPSASTLDVVSGVRDALAGVKLPPGTKVATFYDQSVLIREAIANVRDAVAVGAALAVIVLLVFLRNLRATLVTAAIIPMTLLITFIVIRLLGQSLNLMTLGALAVGIGLVIDDAIVVVENIFHHRANGQTLRDAVTDATAEIAGPMTSSTITTVVVFLPLAFLSGVTGAFFSPLALTLTAALLVSLGLALFVSPALCAIFLRDGALPQEGDGRMVALYERMLRTGLEHRWMLPLGALLVLGITVLLGLRLGLGFMPEMDEGAFVLDYWTPAGTSLTESNHVLMKIENILKNTPDVQAWSRRTGTELGFAITESNRGDFAVTLRDTGRRPIAVVMDEIRGKIADSVAGVDVDFVQVLQDLIGDLSGSASPVEIKLFGSDAAALQNDARRLAKRLEAQAALVDVKSGVVESGPMWVLDVDPMAAGRLGLTADAVASQAQAALAGDVVTSLVEGDRQLAVRVRYPPSWRGDPHRIENLPIRAPSGIAVPFASLGTMRRVAGTAELTRENQRRMIAVTAGLKPGHDLGGAMQAVRSVMAGFSLSGGVTFELGGQYQSQRQAFTNLLAVLAAAIALVFTVMLFGFGSFRLPLLIIMLLPVSLFGVVTALYITSTPLNVSSFMGAIMLVGIVVKNGILLLDRAHHAEASGMTPEDAVLQAGRSRLRPILMTTLTAILGLLPLALGLGAGAEMQKPLAIAVIGGLTCSTVFTLWFAPLLYLQVGRRRDGLTP